MALSPETLPTQGGEILYLSPSTLYYLALYLLVVLVRFFKLKKLGEGKWTYKQVLHVALEIVYTSSGLVILLLEGLKTYQAFIIIVYLILVLVSSHIESMEERFSENATFYTHLGIIAIVVCVTLFFFESIQPSIDAKRRAELAKQAEIDKPNAYRVAIPYEDSTLRAHVGLKTYGGRQLVFVTLIESNSAIRAKERAFEVFWKTVKPYREVEDYRSALFIRQELVTAEPVRK